jgi:hypothetical protein
LAAPGVRSSRGLASGQCQSAPGLLAGALSRASRPDSRNRAGHPRAVAALGGQQRAAPLRPGGTVPIPTIGRYGTDIMPTAVAPSATATAMETDSPARGRILKKGSGTFTAFRGSAQIMNGYPRVTLMVPAAISLLESRNTPAYRRCRMIALYTKGLTAEPRREAARPGRYAAAYRDPGSAAARGIHADQVLRPASHARPGRPPSAGARVAGRVRMITLSGSRPACPIT